MTDFCENCGDDMPESYKSVYCCNEFDCSCQGRITNPPICSEKCYEEVSNECFSQRNKTFL